MDFKKDRHNQSGTVLQLNPCTLAFRVWGTIKESRGWGVTPIFGSTVWLQFYLYQAFRPLLKGAQQPKWVNIGSSSAFLTLGAEAFGFEKAAVTIDDSAAGVVKVTDTSEV
ncbi:hypothetical protein VI817_005988 [Penicillium citrinum]|nr:hypothetical protein VI817_005988 [Penicillium citrinum]